MNIASVVAVFLQGGIRSALPMDKNSRIDLLEPILDVVSACLGLGTSFSELTMQKWLHFACMILVIHTCSNFKSHCLLGKK